MSFFADNAVFFPTPKKMAKRMLAMVEGNPEHILEPSAGKGDLIEALQEHYHDGWYGQRKDIAAIEIDPTLQATLRGKGFKVIDSDFLGYCGSDQFDLIIANPPYASGDLHLLHAIEIMYRGQIVFLLNAETIRNPHTKTRKLLARKLDELGAKVKFYKNAFADAERKTKVDVALVYIKIDRAVEDDLFAGCDDHAARPTEKVEAKHELSTGRTIEELVAQYRETVRIGTEVITTYYRHFKQVGRFLGLNREPREYTSGTDLTTKMQNELNGLLGRVRTNYWRETLNLGEVQSRLTSEKQKEFEHQLQQQCHMDFTEHNIRQFVLNIIGSYEQTITAAVIDLFDKLTRRHAWRDTPLEKNIHYFNGWKTNDAFKVGKRVVIPIHGSYDGPFYDGTFGRWKLNWSARQELHDIDLVMAYFDGLSHHEPLDTAVEKALESGCPSGTSTYFEFRCHKKGTIHLTFRDEGILRRFNVVACRGKGWLPTDYGAREYAQLLREEKDVVDAFEGKASYATHRDKTLFAPPKRLQIAA